MNKSLSRSSFELTKERRKGESDVSRIHVHSQQSEMPASLFSSTERVTAAQGCGLSKLAFQWQCKSHIIKLTTIESRVRERPLKTISIILLKGISSSFNTGVHCRASSWTGKVIPPLLWSLESLRQQVYLRQKKRYDTPFFYILMLLIFSVVSTYIINTSPTFLIRSSIERKKSSRISRSSGDASDYARKDSCMLPSLRQSVLGHLLQVLLHCREAEN